MQLIKGPLIFIYNRQQNTSINCLKGQEDPFTIITDIKLFAAN